MIVLQYVSIIYSFSWSRAFVSVVKELNDIAGQHESIAENLQTNVAKEMTALVGDLKSERKKVGSRYKSTT